MKQRVTQQDIADFLKIPRKIISAALNDVPNGSSRRISVARRDLIKKTAVAMGYVTDDMARAVKTGKAKVIACVSNADRYQPDLLKGISSEINCLGYFLKLFALDKNLVQNCIFQRVSGVIFHSPDCILKEYAEKLYEHSIHVAAVSNTVLKEHCINVKTDDDKGVQLALEYLFSQGHRHIIMISGFLDDNVASQQRCKVYMEIMQAKKLLPRIVSMKIPNYDADYSHMVTMLKPLLEDKATRPTAIIFASWAVAMACVFLMQEMGVNDITLITFGKNPQVSYLSCIDEQWEKMGIKISQLLVDAIEKGSFDYYQELFPPQLHIGEFPLLTKHIIN